MRGLLALLLLLSSIALLRADSFVDFDTEIIPILTRQGCNAGSCHGAAIGRGGFKLSLLGSDAASDHVAIVHQLQGRRVNLHDPERSLVLRKPAEQVGHEGGMKLEAGSNAFESVHTWIQQGGKRRQLRQLSRLVVSPEKSVLDDTQETVTVTVTATFDDGQTTDVTGSTVLTADDPEAVNVDHATGRLTVLRGGVHVVIARYLDRVIPIRLTAPLNDRLPTATRHAANQIDVLINRQLDELRLPSSPMIDAGPLLRRLTLDLIGRLPTLAEYQRFQQHPSVADVVDRLLKSEQFAQYWALKWANVLQIDSKQLQPEGAAAFQQWLAEQLGNDTAMTDLAVAMLTSVGDSYGNGPVNFLRTGMSPGDLAERASQVFMGARLRCANCHNHPLDHWTQDDYHGLAAVFAKVKRGPVVTVSKRGEVTHPVTGQAAIPRIPGLRFLTPDRDGRGEFATWLTARDNPYLARVTVNRIWQQLMGRGLVEPVDDLRATNPASNPELLDWLTQDFVDNGFHCQHTIRTICLSAAYRRSSRSVTGNETDNKFFSKALLRPLEAEVISDAMGDATGVPIQHGNSADIRAVALTDNRVTSEALDVLGRCDRSQSCDASESAGGSLARTLHMINGPLVNQRITSPAGRLANLLATQHDDHVVLDQLYTITLGQPAGNRSYWQQRFDEAKLDDPQARQAFFEDVFWSLLTSESFITNH